ncbi:unnamed protein product [Diplocarpon coronariae]
MISCCGRAVPAAAPFHRPKTAPISDPRSSWERNAGADAVAVAVAVAVALAVAAAVRFHSFSARRSCIARQISQCREDAPHCLQCTAPPCNASAVYGYPRGQATDSCSPASSVPRPASQRTPVLRRHSQLPGETRYEERAAAAAAAADDSPAPGQGSSLQDMGFPSRPGQASVHARDNAEPSGATVRTTLRATSSGGPGLLLWAVSCAAMEPKLLNREARLTQTEPVSVWHILTMLGKSRPSQGPSQGLARPRKEVDPRETPPAPWTARANTPRLPPHTWRASVDGGANSCPAGRRHLLLGGGGCAPDLHAGQHGRAADPDSFPSTARKSPLAVSSISYPSVRVIAGS